MEYIISRSGSGRNNNAKHVSKFKNDINIINDDIPAGIIFGNSFKDLEHAFLMLNNQSCRICNKKMLNIINYDYRYDINCFHSHSYHTSCLLSAVCESYDEYIIGCDICHIYIRHIPAIKEAMREQNAPEPLRRSARIASMKKINYIELNNGMYSSDDDDDDSSYEESEDTTDDEVSSYEDSEDDDDVEDEIYTFQIKKLRNKCIKRIIIDTLVLMAWIYIGCFTWKGMRMHYSWPSPLKLENEHA
jgi:hypothetical protein